MSFPRWMSFGRYRLSGTPQRRAQRMPGQRRTFHTRRKLPNTSEHHQLAEVLRQWLICGQEVVELRQQSLGLANGFALQDLGHQRRRGGRNCAPGSLERHLVDHAVVFFEKDLALIPAQRVVAFGFPIRVFERLEVSRSSAVVEDGVLIEVVDHTAKTSLTF